MSIVLAHPGPAIWGTLAILVCLTAAAILRLTGETGGHHKNPRLRSRFAAGAARAWRRVTVSARRLPGAIRRRFERPLSAYDRTTLALLPALNAQDAGGLRALHHPDLVPGAGLSELLSPVTTATCPRDDATLKVDSPAPEHHPMPAHDETLWATRPAPVLDYQPAPPLASMLSDDTIARGMTAVT